MKKVIPPVLFFLSTVFTLQAQNLKTTKPLNTNSNLTMNSVKVQAPFLVIHKEKDSPFEIYQDLIQDELVIRLKNQFDVLRFTIRDEAGNSLPIKGKQDKTEVHADLKTLVNGKYRLIVDRNDQKIFTEFFLNR
ncbi:MAG: hypothetical protein ABI844_11995 [Saprospiraceae bacterium]